MRNQSNSNCHLKVTNTTNCSVQNIRVRRSQIFVEHLTSSGKRADKVRSFFTSERPRSYRAYQGNGARWRYFGHACILLETRNTSILLDPVLSYTYESDISRFTYDDLPEVIDFVLITHNHQDHILFETLLQLRHRIRTVVVPRNSGGSLQGSVIAVATSTVRLQKCRRTFGNGNDND